MDMGIYFCEIEVCYLVRFFFFFNPVEIHGKIFKAVAVA
jgi:hypothetical protein